MREDAMLPAGLKTLLNGETPPLTPALCEALLDAAGTPEQVRHHCRAVAEKADALARQLPPGAVDRDGLYAAALLHDIARTFPDHARVGAEWMEALGYPEIAGWIACHHDLPAPERVSEAVVLYLADKLIQEDREVTLEERFTKSEEKCRSPEALEKHRARYAQALAARQCVERAIQNGGSHV